MARGDGIPTREPRRTRPGTEPEISETKLVRMPSSGGLAEGSRSWRFLSVGLLAPVAALLVRRSLQAVVRPLEGVSQVRPPRPSLLSQSLRASEASLPLFPLHPLLLLVGAVATPEVVVAEAAPCTWEVAVVEWAVLSLPL